MFDESRDPRPSFFVAAAALWLLGFVFSLTPFSAYKDESLMLAVMCIVFSALFILPVFHFSHLKKICCKPLFLGVLGLWAVALASAVLSEVWFVSFISFCFFSVFPLSFFVVALHDENRCFLKLMGYGLVVFYFSLAVFAIGICGAALIYFFAPSLDFLSIVELIQRSFVDSGVADLTAYSDPLRFWLEMAVFVPILMVGGALLGFWFIQTQNVLYGDERQDDEALHEYALVRAVLALPLVFALGVFSIFQSSEILVDRSYKNMEKGQIDQAIQEINRAGRLSGNLNVRALIAASNFPLGILQLNAALMPKDELQQVYDQVDRLLSKAESLNPRLAQTFYHRGELELYAGAFVETRSEDVLPAQLYFEKALTLEPRHISSRLKLADFALRKKQPQEALAILKDGLAWSYKTQNPKFFLEKTMRLAKTLGDDGTYEMALRAYQKYFPEGATP